MAAAVLAIAGCSVTDLEENNAVSKDTFRLTAEITTTRTTFDPAGYKVAWDADDALSVIASDGGIYTGYMFSKVQDAGDNVFGSDNFVMTETMEALSVIYPYSEALGSIVDGNTDGAVTIGSAAGQAQKQTGDNPGSNVDAPLYGYAEISSGEGWSHIEMHHASSLVEVTVSNSASADLAITDIDLTTTAGCYLSGEFQINPQTGAIVAAGTDRVSEEASLDITDVTVAQGESRKFYITVAPFTLAAGDAVNVYVTANGSRMLFRKEMTEERTFAAGTVNRTSVDIASVSTITLDRTSVAYDFMENPDPEQVTLRVTGSGSGLVWATSDKYVVTVDNGALTPVGHGKAVVTVTDESGAVAECTVTVNGVKDLNYGNGDEYYNKVYLPVNIEVTGADGQPVVQTWLDRNLGASQVATAYNDYQAYGSSFQWSRKADGHEQLNWTSGTYANRRIYGTTSELAADRSNAGNAFILTDDDWADDANSEVDGLWGGGHRHGGIDTGYAAPLDDAMQENNPCPLGYRVPTSDELYSMIGGILGLDALPANGSVTVSGALNTLASSVLHLPASGFSNNAGTTGLMSEAGSAVGLWCNTTASNVTAARRVHVRDALLSTAPQSRARGYAVRCIRDTALPTVSLE